MMLKKKDMIKLFKIMILIFLPLTLLMVIGIVIHFDLSNMLVLILFLIILFYFLSNYLKEKKKLDQLISQT